MERADGRAANELRPITIETGFQRHPEGSALIKCGDTWVLCAASVARGSFAGLCVAAFLLGANMAFVQQYRFAAAEFVGPAQAGRAVSTVMLGCSALGGCQARYRTPPTMTSGLSVASIGIGWPLQVIT